jgi:hypothetical protein
MIKLTMATGEVLTGTPNYTTVSHVEIRLTDGSFVWLERSAIDTIHRI